jgi:hypothetical protein
MRIDHHQQQDHFLWIDLIGRPQALCRPLLYHLVIPFEQGTCRHVQLRALVNRSLKDFLTNAFLLAFPFTQGLLLSIFPAPTSS